MSKNNESGTTERIIQAFFTVYNELGYGFLESVYQNAMYFELKKLGFEVECQKEINVHYQGQLVGKFKADLLIDNSIILELKAVASLTEEHEYQLINYLKATEIELGLLLNFGAEPQVRRKIYDNENKNLCKSVREASVSSVC